MKKAFTLIEIIFVIVIIGLLAAVAIPRLLHLKQNAEAAPLLEALSDINGSGVASSYFNNVLVNGIKKNELNISQLMKMNGNYWTTYVDSNGHETNATYREGYYDLNATFYYHDGEIDVTIHCDTSTDQGNAIRAYLQRYGYDCTKVRGKTFKFYISTQEDN
jgi:prepilin-type N-terminal cleavage/methylation domain-containing protein